MSDLSSLKSDLAALSKTLSQYRDGQVVKRGPGRPSVSSQEQAEADGKVLGGVLGQFRDILETMMEKLEKIDEYDFSTISNDSAVNSNLVARVEDLEYKSRVQTDTLDHHHQRSLRGKFFITASKNERFLDSKGLLDNKLTLPEYVCNKVFKKFKIKQHPSEIKSCHFTNSGGIIYRYANFSPDSSYARLVVAIKKGHGRENEQLYFNFAMTPHRATLLYHLRQLKKEGSIAKFYSDSDGSLSFIKSDADNKIYRITSLYDKKSSTLSNYSVDELMEAVGAKK